MVYDKNEQILEQRVNSKEQPTAGETFPEAQRN